MTPPTEQIIIVGFLPNLKREEITRYIIYGVYIKINELKDNISSNLSAIHPITNIDNSIPTL